MQSSDFVIILSRQRSGTNALRSVLNLHPDIFSVPEIFDNRMADNWDIIAGTNTFRAIETTYFRFLEKRSTGRLREILLAEDDEALFLEFLEYLRCFTDKRYLALDIKYLSTHHIRKAWHFITEEPFLFTLIKKHGLRVLNLTRRNLLRYYLSEVKAKTANNWHAFDESVVGEKRWYKEWRKSATPTDDAPVQLNIPDLLQNLQLCKSENEVVERSFAGYAPFLTFDYDDMFKTLGAPIADPILNRITGWLEIPAGFAQKKPEYKKLSNLPLEKAIANYSEVAEALRGTDFEYCLTDERMYHPASARNKSSKQKRSAPAVKRKQQASK